MPPEATVILVGALNVYPLVFKVAVDIAPVTVRLPLRVNDPPVDVKDVQDIVELAENVPPVHENVLLQTSVPVIL